ncbi:HEAT repeat domain-containing protein [bacterium]|nr:HEAT repeat domain-containing protein [bacterium]
MRTDIIKAKQLLDKDDFFSKSKGISLIKHIYDSDAIVVLKTYQLTMDDPNLIELCAEAADHLEKNLIAREKVKNDVRKSIIGIPVNENTPQWHEFCEKIAPIIADLEAEKNPFVKATVVKQIGNYKNEYAIPCLVKHLNDGDDRVKANTIEGLYTIGTERILQHIVPLLGDSSARVRANASKAVWKFSAAKVYLVLSEMLTSKDTNIQKSAIFSINNIKTPESIELLRSAMGHMKGYEQNYARQVIKTYDRELLKKKLKSPQVVIGSVCILVSCLLLFFAFHQFSWDQTMVSESKEIGKMRNEVTTIKTADGREVTVKVPKKFTYIKKGNPAMIQGYARLSGAFINDIDKQYYNSFDDKKNDACHAAKNTRIRYARFLMSNKAYNKAEILYRQILSENLENDYIAIEVLTDIYTLYTQTGNKEKLKELKQLVKKLKDVKIPTMIGGKSRSISQLNSYASDFSKVLYAMALVQKEKEATVLKKLRKFGIKKKEINKVYDSLKKILIKGSG